MSFLQPLLLIALPLIALPILIHLVNQRRYQTMRWAAMIFLLEANRLSRGFARLRQWLILAARVLVIAGLIFALARPLASGWLGLAAGSRTDTTIVLLDRSPSMSTVGDGSIDTKLDTGRRHLAETFAKIRSDHWVLIDSASTTPQVMQSPDDLLTSTEAEPVGASANIPAMLQAAHEYIQGNQTGRTDIWICSDLRRHDWDSEGGQWPALRESFLDLPQTVRFYLLAFPEAPSSNSSLRLTEIQRSETSDGAALLVSLELARDDSTTDAKAIPVEFDIDGARSVVNVEMSGSSHELKNHEIPLGRDQIRGWGRVSIPADANNLDNEFFFVFDRQPVRKALVVGAEELDGHALRLAAEISADPSVDSSVEVVTPAQLASTAWDEVGLVLWHAPIPDEEDAAMLRSFVDNDGQIVLISPPVPNSNSIFGLTWENWQSVPDDVTVGNWRGDADLLSHTQNGAALPVGELKIHRRCQLQGEVTPLATFSDGSMLLGRAVTGRGAVYALATTPASKDSSLASNGIVLYVMVQRALAAGCQRLGQVRQLVAGIAVENSSNWRRLAGADHALSDQYALHSGVFESEGRLLALNRSADEDVARVLSAEETSRLFEDLDFVRIEDRAGENSSLVQEIWRIFLFVMLAALIAEAALCLPKVRATERVLA